MKRRGLLILCFASIMAALAIVLKTYCSITTPTGRITIYDIPLILTGIMFGPFIGGLTGFITDWVYSLLAGYGALPSLYTISSMLWGIIPGLFYFLKRKNKKEIIFCTIVTSLIVYITNAFAVGFDQAFINGSFIGEKLINGMKISLINPLRFVPMIVKIPIQSFVIYILYNRVYVDYFTKNKDEKEDDLN